MQPRFAVILIALLLLGGIAGCSPLLSRAVGISAGDPALPVTTSVPLVSPTMEASGTGDFVGSDTGTSPTLTPSVTPTEYIEQDSILLPDIRATTLPTASPSVTATTPTSPQTRTLTVTDRTPSVTDTPEKVSLSESDPGPITIRLTALGDDFSPSSVSVPAGAEVTIVFDNRDENKEHSVVVYADRDTPPIFTGTVIRGQGRTTDTFTAPSEPGKYVLGCGVPTPHKKGTFIVT